MTRADDLALIERCLAARDIHTMSERGHACAIYAADRDRLCALARAGLDAVPREPDAAMRQAGNCASYCVGINADDHTTNIWRAMHDAWTGREHD